MMMSVYLQRQPRKVLDHVAILSGIATNEDIELVNLAANQGKPAIISFNGLPAVVKPEEEGDEAQSFEAFYDNAITLNLLGRMKEQKVENPDQVSDVYRIVIAAAVTTPCRLPGLYMRLPPHKNVGEALSELWENDPVFREEFINTLFERLRAVGDIQFKPIERRKCDNALGVELGEARWKFDEDD